MSVIFPLDGKLPTIIQIYSLMKPIAVLIEYAQQSTSYSPLVDVIRMFRNYLSNNVVFDRSKLFNEIDATRDNQETERIPFIELLPLTKTVCNAIRRVIYDTFLKKLYLQKHSRILDIVMYLHPIYKLEHVDIQLCISSISQINFREDLSKQFQSIHTRLDERSFWNDQ